MAHQDTAKMTKFDQAKAYAPQEEGTGFFDDGREIELLHFVYSHPDLENIRGSPEKVLQAIDEYGRTKKYLMNVGEDKGRIVCDLIAEVKPKVMVELGGYVGYSCVLFGNAVRKAGGQRYYSLEMNPEFAAVIMSLVDLAGLSDVVKVVVGSSDASIARLHAQGLLRHIDLMFLDHYKPAYTTDLKLCEELKLITPGSVLAADNVIKPGNPPYLEYVRDSVEEKRRKLGAAVKSESLPGKTVNQYQKRYGEMKFNQSPGNPDLVYESRLVHSFEPTGVPKKVYEGTPSATLASSPLPHAANLPSHLPTMAIFYRHEPKNILLILLSVLCLPISATITLASFLYFYLCTDEATRPQLHTTSRRKTILVTGISMTKGLTIARLLAKHTPHRIIAADTEPIPFTSPGRFSRAIAQFYRLSSPQGANTKPYVDSLLDLIRRENVHLWISCSSVLGAIEDGEVMRSAQKERGKQFHAVQFDSDVVNKLHEKDAFIEYIQSIGLLVPESHRCTSAAQVEDILTKSTSRNGTEKPKGGSTRFILKPIGVDDKARAQMMTLLPLSAGPKATASYLSMLNISPSNPYILQQYITGPEYCTHSLVVRGEVKAFVSCPSSDLLMHYAPLPVESPLNTKMLEFTKRVAEEGGEEFTGHLSFDFLVEGEGQNAKLYPIECNPRAHTAVVLFRETPAMAEAYLSCFESELSLRKPLVVPAKPTRSYYWIGHDLVTLLLIPALTLFSGEGSVEEVKSGLETLWQHLVHWRDGTYTAWDPVPFFMLYHVYWPSRFLESLVRGKEWSRINVSTTKMFAC
ncbi:hypothetical protein ASPACDRAFT_31348 [Aspergillus aculeatus ATCC 16872]|uniref:catechol O-methyltransferase n=1 Tax=Aspergillus aculeatus (strain ATCC 16872 / CBS 172.66 / WB 5094) TaxID=690307 RepID=A0A1L9WQS5_ASPA1|nr:uncharacterized protein ASPACDRAFT_31348 [Aspergillus aculeatus ATCC 16872]OJJ98458.1 hypothetical protein ASPACDRAFT_31348 [Aspergillus aculeatus ATCC 16872]